MADWFFINVHSDSILLNLRPRNTLTIIEGKIYYKPHGRLFKYVSAANYFGEIIEWLGFAISSRNKTAFAFWSFVCVNLIPTGYSHHQWYKENFHDYPKHRKALIPFVW